MSGHVALVFPGRRYGPELPLLRYPMQALAQLGAEVHVIDYPDPSSPSLVEHVVAAVEEAAAGAARVTLLAKSLGTRLIAQLPEKVLPRDVDAVWLTPIFSDAGTAAAAAEKRWRSLYVYGTADPSCDEQVLDPIVRTSRGDVLIIEGGDHGLEVSGDAYASAQAVLRVTDAVLAFSRRMH